MYCLVTFEQYELCVYLWASGLCTRKHKFEWQQQRIDLFFGADSFFPLAAVCIGRIFKAKFHYSFSLYENISLWVFRMKRNQIDCRPHNSILALSCFKLKLIFADGIPFIRIYIIIINVVVVVSAVMIKQTNTESIFIFSESEKMGLGTKCRRLSPKIMKPPIRWQVYFRSQYTVFVQWPLIN